MFDYYHEKIVFNFNKNFLKILSCWKNKLKNQKKFITIETIKFYCLEIEKINFEKSKKYGINYNHNIILRLNNFAKKKLKFETKDLIKVQMKKICSYIRCWS